MPTVVSNSSTLIHLAKIGLLDLLREQFGHVIVPEAVWREVVEEGAARGGRKAFRGVEIGPNAHCRGGRDLRCSGDASQTKARLLGKTREIEDSRTG